MNCKPGDLAVIVRGASVGTLVTCIALSDRYIEPVWRIETMSGGYGRHRDSRNSPLKRVAAGHRAFIADSSLRPLRDPSGEDEMLRIAGLPEKTSQPA